jgi:hypothetical protein
LKKWELCFDVNWDRVRRRLERVAGWVGSLAEVGSCVRVAM